jgi:hypothetical protein
MSPIRTSFAVIAAVVVVLTGVSLARTNHAAVDDAPARSVFYHPGGIVMLGDFYVPPDEEIVFTGPVDLRATGEIVIDGVVRGVGMSSADEAPYLMQFSSMTGIVIRGELICYPGYDGKEFGEDGGRGGDLVLRAPILFGATEVKGGRGGNGAIGGGDGGRGGTLMSYGAAIVRPDSERAIQYLADQREHDQTPSPTFSASWLSGGDGGKGGPGDARTGRPGGDGGGGGRGTGRHFVEADWMVYYRSRFHMNKEDSAAALERSEEEIASGVIQKRFKRIPASQYKPSTPDLGPQL